MEDSPAVEGPPQIRIKSRKLEAMILFSGLMYLIVFAFKVEGAER